MRRKVTETMVRAVELGLVAALAASCGASAEAGGGHWGQRIADAAVWHLAHTPAFARRDCSGLVVAVLARAGLDLAGNTRTLWADAQRSGRLAKRPRPGDLAFFDRTYDANRNGRVDDELTHVAIVTAIGANGAVELVHYGSGRIRRLHLNLRRPHTHRAEGEVLNDYLRSPSYGRPSTPRLAGELLRGFARPPAPAR